MQDVRTYYSERGTAEQLAAEGRPRWEMKKKKDQGARRYWYWVVDNTMRPLGRKAKTWVVAAPGRGW